MWLWQVLLLAVRIVNPLYVPGNRISVSDIDGLKIFKLYEHPEIWKERIEGKKGISIRAATVQQTSSLLKPVVPAHGATLRRKVSQGRHRPSSHLLKCQAIHIERQARLV